MKKAWIIGTFLLAGSLVLTLAAISRKSSTQALAEAEPGQPNNKGVQDRFKAIHNRSQSELVELKTALVEEKPSLERKLQLASSTWMAIQPSIQRRQLEAEILDSLSDDPALHAMIRSKLIATVSAQQAKEGRTAEIRSFGIRFLAHLESKNGTEELFQVADEFTRNLRHKYSSLDTVPEGYILDLEELVAATARLHKDKFLQSPQDYLKKLPADPIFRPVVSRALYSVMNKSDENFKKIFVDFFHSAQPNPLLETNLGKAYPNHETYKKAS